MTTSRCCVVALRSPGASVTPRPVQNGYNRATSEIGVTEARDQLGQLVNRAEYNEERIVLTRNGRAVAALVPINVLRDLEAAEDAADLEAARRAAAEGGPNVPHAEVLADLVADEAQSRSA